MSRSGHVLRHRGTVAWIVAVLLTLLLSGIPEYVQAPTSWTISPVVGGGGSLGAGSPVSMALDSAGRPHIAYGGGPGLSYASWTGSSWQFEAIDSSTGLGYPMSLKLDKNDSPSVAYPDDLNKDLRYAHKESGSWIVEVVDSYGDVGYWTSLALDSLGRPHIAYQNDSNPGVNSTLKYAIKDNGTWRIETLWDLGSYGSGFKGLSLALNSTDAPRIAFTGWSHIGYAYLEGASWRIETIQMVSGQTGDAPSMVLDSLEIPHVSFSRPSPTERLEYAKRGPMGWVTETVELDRGAYSDITVDNEDRPHIAYTGPRSPAGTPAYLYYAESNGPGWLLDTVDPQESNWEPPSIAIDGCDGVHIAYWHYTPGVENWVRYAYRPGQDISSPKTAASVQGTYWRNSSPMVVQGSAYDSCSGVANVTLRYRHSADNSTWGAWTHFSTLASPPWTWSFSFPDGEGYYEFYTTSVDSVGNAESPPFTADAIAAYDATPPVSTALPISPYWHATPSLTMNATAIDNLSGVADVALLYSHAPLDNSTWSPWASLGTKTVQPWSWSFPFPDGEGHYKFHTIAQDVAGNVEGNKDYAEAIAGYRIPPDYVPTSPTPVSPLTVGLSESVHLAMSVRNLGGSANNDSSLAFYNASTPSSPFSVLTVPPISKSGIVGPFEVNWSSPASPCTCAVTAHVDYYGDIAESNETNNTYTWTMNVVPGPITKPDYVPAEPNPPMTVKIGLSSLLSLSIKVLNQGNATATADATLAFYNDTPPATPFANFTVQPIAPAANSSMFTATWLSPATSGTCYVSANVDYYDNVTEWDETNNVYTWTIEAVAGPVTSLVIGNPNYTSTATYVTSSTPLNLSVFDQSGLGINYTKYRIDNVTWYDYTGTPFVLSGEKDHYVEYYSEDGMGNVEEVNHRVLRVDDTPPATILSIGDPKHLVGGSFTTSSTPISLQATDGGAIPVGVESTRYQVDGSGWKDYSSPFTLAGEGPHTVEYRSYDLLTNEETIRTIQIVVDDTPPATTLSIGVPKHLVGGNFTTSSTPLTLHADDGGSPPVGANSTFHRLWSGTWSSWREYASSFTLTGRDGTWFVEFLSFDLLGNREDVQNVTLVLDDTPPATTLLPATSPYTTDTLFTLTATDAGSGVNVTRYRIDGGSWTTYSGGFKLTEGERNISYLSIDNLNNTEQERWLVVNVQAQPPPPPVEANYKPLVAAVFVIVLVIVGLWSSRRRPWKDGKDGLAVVKAFVFISLPFVLAEGATGIISLLTGELGIPPTVGVGTAVDTAILTAGLAVALMRTVKSGHPDEHSEKEGEA